MRRVGVWLFCVVLMLVLAACNGGTSAPVSGGQTEGTSAPAAEPAKGEPVELVMYSWRTEDKDAYAKFLTEFEKQHTNIKVKFKSFKSTEYNTILSNSLTSGTGVDIVQLRPYSGATSIADAGYLLPLDDVKGVAEIEQSYWRA